MPATLHDSYLRLSSLTSSHVDVVVHTKIIANSEGGTHFSIVPLAFIYLLVTQIEGQVNFHVHGINGQYWIGETEDWGLVQY